MLLHALILAARLDDGSLIDVPTILTNAAFRRRVLAKVGDPLIIGPWAAGFDSLSEQERARVVMPVLNKTRALTNRAAIRRMVGQATPRFTLDELFRSPKIVLVSLNAGIIGPETAKLLGGIILGQFWEAIQRQASVSPSERRPVMAVVDELADFTAGLDFAEVLTKARGMNVSFTVAHQHLRQLHPSLRAALLANARSRVELASGQGRRQAAGRRVRRLGGHPDEAACLPRGRPGAGEGHRQRTVHGQDAAAARTDQRSRHTPRRQRPALRHRPQRPSTPNYSHAGKEVTQQRDR